VADEHAGEVPVAFVVLKAQRSTKDSEIADFIGSQVAHYKRLSKVTFVEAIPKSPSGTILRRVLRERAA
jgi:acyl-CoA synthetase (AMP-forming)/AMP-acid ligase II